MSSTAATSSAIAPRTAPVTRSPTGTAARCRAPSPRSVHEPGLHPAAGDDFELARGLGGGAPRRPGGPRRCSCGCPTTRGWRRPGQRRPELGRAIGRGESSGRRNAGRHHADHGAGPAIELDLAPDHARVATEAPLPQAVADHNRAGGASGDIGRREHAAERRRHAQGGEQFGGDRRRDDAFGLGAVGEAAGGRGVGSDVLAAWPRRAGSSPLPAPTARWCRPARGRSRGSTSRSGAPYGSGCSTTTRARLSTTGAGADAQAEHHDGRQR